MCFFVPENFTVVVDDLCQAVFYVVVDRPLPTFLKNKKKRKPIVSDGSDVERTPPASPTDDSLVCYRPL